ncbi:10827_t:CDS:1, partial [Dentiscutata erythropus]
TIIELEMFEGPSSLKFYQRNTTFIPIIYSISFHHTFRISVQHSLTICKLACSLPSISSEFNLLILTD